MDVPNFDAITRRLSCLRSRRTALGAFAAGAAALAGPARELNAKKKKKPKKVTLCLNGQSITVSKKQRNGYIRQGATAGKCAAGGAATGCTTNAACNACARETCQAGACACPTGLTRDANGVCGEALDCKSTGNYVSSMAECCSQNGVTLPTNPVSYQCVPGNERCNSSMDCVLGSKCLGGMCPVKYLATVGQQCAPTVGCPSPLSCGTDTQGACTCAPAGRCASSEAQIVLPPGSSCDDCPAGTARCGDIQGMFTTCHSLCAQPFACCTKAGDSCGGGKCRF